MTTIYETEPNNIINPMTELLRWIGLYNLVDLFNYEEIDIEVFPYLTIEDMIELGISNDNINDIIVEQNNNWIPSNMTMIG
jgi:hypothetical protein